MEIADTATMRTTPTRVGPPANTTARDVTMRVQSSDPHAVQKPNPDTGGDSRGDKELIHKLAACGLFQDYQKAFGQATGLPLSLRSAEDWQLAHAGNRHQNGFCALVARNNESCAACLQMQQQVCNQANGVPATLKCSFGLSETAVTVKLGGRTIGYLQTGQVFFSKPTAAQTASAANRLQKLGPGSMPGKLPRLIKPRARGATTNA
ncbi:MAG: PocR ligand-binding domain-containing protein [Verrucomicrobiota bacterium]